VEVWGASKPHPEALQLVHATARGRDAATISTCCMSKSRCPRRGRSRRGRGSDLQLTCGKKRCNTAQLPVEKWHCQKLLKTSTAPLQVLRDLFLRSLARHIYVQATTLTSPEYSARQPSCRTIWRSASSVPRYAGSNPAPSCTAPRRQGRRVGCCCRYATLRASQRTSQERRRRLPSLPSRGAMPHN
jgi:hypothetical protein